MSPTLPVTMTLPLTTAYGFITARAPYLAAAVRLLDVTVGDGTTHGTDKTARIHLSETLCESETETVRNTAAALVCGLWRVARFHHERSARFSGSAEVWNAASSALCFADAQACLTTSASAAIDMPAGFTSLDDLRHAAHTARRVAQSTPEWWTDFLIDTRTPVSPLFVDLAEGETETETKDETEDNAGDQPGREAGGLDETTRAERVREALREGIMAHSAAGASQAVPEHAVAWARTCGQANPLDVSRFGVARAKQAMLTHARTFRPTYRRPARRGHSVPDGLLLPAYTPESTRVLAAVDVSASMSDTALTRAVELVAAMAAGTGNDLDYFSVSTRTYPVRHYSGGDVVIDRDCAGTDMRAAWTVFQHNPDALPVVITDGKTPWPETTATPAVIVIVADDADEFAAARQRVPHAAGVLWSGPRATQNPR